MKSWIGTHEKRLVLCLLVLFFLLNLLIASRSPFGGWMDEVTYVDPGLNLASGKGWVSSVWPWQTDHDFWAANSPLYPGALSVWVRLFGISVISARAYCYFLAGIGLSLLWLGTYRFKLLTPAYRLFWVIFLSTEYSMNWMERNERYDVWILVGLGLAWFAASLRHARVKYPLLFLGCFTVPLGGFIGVPYVFLLSGLTVLLTWFRYWKEAACAILGAVLGVFGVMGFYASFGHLNAFRVALSQLTVVQGQAHKSVLKIFLYPSEDLGAVVLIGLLVMMTLFFWKKGGNDCHRWLGLGWGMVFLMPVMMMARGIFVMAYFYMLLIPVSLAILQLAVRARTMVRGGYVIAVATILIGLLCLGGLPARMFFSLTEWKFRDPSNIQDFVRTYVHPTDRVFSDYFFYFALRDYVPFLATRHYIQAIPPDEASQINVAIVPDDEFPDLMRDSSVLESIGGGWQKIAVFPTPQMKVEAPAHFASKASQRTFTLYRRTVTQH